MPFLAIFFLSTAAFAIWFVALELLHASGEVTLNADRDQIKYELTQEYERRQEVLHAAKQRAEKLEQQWRERAARLDGDFAAYKAKLEYFKSEYVQIQARHGAELSQLKASAETMQRQAFLERFYLSNDKIPKIGPTRLAVLASYGIETAADVTKDAILQIQGFGESLAGNLVDWRRKIESGFRFDPKTGIPADVVRNLELKYVAHRQATEAELRPGPARLQLMSKQGGQQLESDLKQILPAFVKVAQAKADCSVIDADSLKS